MNRFVFVIIVVVVAFAVPAQAGTKVTLNGTDIVVDSEVAACFETCSKQVNLVQKKVEVKKKAAVVLAKKVETAKGPDKEKAKTAADLENAEIAKLEGQIDALKKRIETAEKAAKDGNNDLLLKDMVELHGQVVGFREDVTQLRADIAAIDRTLNPVHIGPRIGAMAWKSLDGTSYTGALVSARLTLRGEKVDVFVEPLIGIANQRSPFSAGVGGGILVPFKDKFAVEIAPLLGSHTIDNRLRAKSILLALDVGLTYRPTGGLVIGLAGLAGCEFDQGTPTAAFGGKATVGWDF